VYLLKKVKVRRHEIHVYEDDAYCYIEVFDENGKRVENVAMSECEGTEFNEFVKKYEGI